MPNSVDARSDLYAVGAVGYFLLTGQPVFEAENVVDLCQKHVATPPVPPSERSRTPIPGRAGKRAPGLPGKIAGQAPANGPRPGATHRALPGSDAVVDRRRRRLVGPPRTRARDAEHVAPH